MCWDDDQEMWDDCQTCGGDGVTECDDPIQCTAQHFDSDWETCPNCRGSGRAKDQWFW